MKRFTLLCAIFVLLAHCLTAQDMGEKISAGLPVAVLNLNITDLTLADADDEIDFYVQTSYDHGTTWVDCQNFHFTNADNGTAANLQAIIDGALDGPGTIKSITGTDPVAGSEISETVPANTIWRFWGAVASLVTDATVANRRVKVLIDDGTTTVFPSDSSSVQAASQTESYIIGPHAGVVADHWIPTPPGMLVLAGWRVQTSTTLIKTGDNWGAPQLTVEEWHDPAVRTDGTMRDNVKSYERPVGTHVRIRDEVTGATDPTYAYSASVHFKAR